jgi:hypothetical protein
MKFASMRSADQSVAHNSADELTARRALLDKLFRRDVIEPAQCLGRDGKRGCVDHARAKADTDTPLLSPTSCASDRRRAQSTFDAK